MSAQRQGDVCENCVYFRREQPTRKGGNCRCNPPTAEGFPFVHWTAWCGKFELADAKDPTP